MEHDNRDNKEKSANPHAGHRSRMAERFRLGGFHNYRPHEVIEQLLFAARPRVNTNEIAHALIDAFGSVEAVLEADPRDLTQIDGIGQASAHSLVDVRETVSAVIRAQYAGASVRDPYTRAFLADWFLRDAQPSVGILLTDADDCFYDFRTGPLLRNPDGTLDAEALFGRCGADCDNKLYALYVRERDALSADDIRVLRRYTFARSLILDELYWLDRRHPRPLLHPSEDD